MSVPKDPSFGNVPEADQAGKAQESIGAVDEIARGFVEVTTGGVAEVYTVQTSAPYLVLISNDEAWRYGDPTFTDGVIDEYGTPDADSFLVPQGVPWKIRSPGEGNDVGLVAETTGTRIYILETD